MGKVLTTDVEVEVTCEDLHCDECAVCKSSEANQLEFESASEALQQAFNEVGPARDRLTDWQKCDQEPWRTIARLFDL